MARTDAVQFFLELAAEWRRLGAEVTFEPGWERRGNGTSPAYEGGIVHHTGFVSSFANPFPALGTLLNGRPDLRGPLANVGGPVCPLDRPRLHVISAFPANHAGASGGRSMGPLPVSSLFNRLVVGLEIDYAGLTPMIGGQYRAGLIFARGLANVLRRSVEYARAHGETSVTGKWDIGVGNGRAQTYDMAAFRRDAANFNPTQEDDMPLTDADVVKIFWGTKFRGEANFAQVVHDIEDQASSANVRAAALSATIDKLAEAIAAGANNVDADDLKATLAASTETAVRKVLEEQLEPFLRTALTEAQKLDNEDQVDELFAEIIERLRPALPSAT